jgi:glycosyltransferase involved in cell wall biosynthesis
MRLSYYSFDSLGNPWVAGGAARRDWEVLKEFSRSLEVTLLVGTYRGFRPGVYDGVHVRALGRGTSHWMSRLTYTVGANARVLFDRAEILGNSISPYAPLLTGLLRRSRLYGVYHHIAGSYSRDRHGPAGWVVYVLERALLRHGRQYVVSNETVYQKLHALNPGASIFTTFNAFDPDLLDRARGSSDPPYILFVGRLDTHMKGLDILVPAYGEAVYDKGIDLVLAGRASPTVLKELEALVPARWRSRVRIEPNISEDRKAELMASCLFFCSPSRIEGFGMAALEANAAGKAVLATDVDGFRASLAFGETALAVPPNDRPALQAALARLTDDSELRERMGLAGRERAKRYSWRAVAEAEKDWLVAAIADGAQPDVERPSHASHEA